MKRLPKWLESMIMAYAELLSFEKLWLEQHGKYAQWVLRSKGVLCAAVCILIVVGVVVMLVKLGWVVIVIPMG